MSAALDRALERGLASHGRRALPAVQGAGVGGASAVLAAAAGEGSGLGSLGRGSPARHTGS